MNEFMLKIVGKARNKNYFFVVVVCLATEIMVQVAGV